MGVKLQKTCFSLVILLNPFQLPSSWPHWTVFNRPSFCNRPKIYNSSFVGWGPSWPSLLIGCAVCLPQLQHDLPARDHRKSVWVTRCGFGWRSREECCEETATNFVNAEKEVLQSTSRDDKYEWRTMTTSGLVWEMGGSYDVKGRG